MEEDGELRVVDGVSDDLVDLSEVLLTVLLSCHGRELTSLSHSEHEACLFPVCQCLISLVCGILTDLVTYYHLIHLLGIYVEHGVAAVELYESTSVAQSSYSSSQLSLLSCSSLIHSLSLSDERVQSLESSHCSFKVGPLALSDHLSSSDSVSQRLILSDRLLSLTLTPVEVSDEVVSSLSRYVSSSLYSSLEESQGIHVHLTSLEVGSVLSHSSSNVNLSHLLERLLVAHLAEVPESSVVHSHEVSGTVLSLHTHGDSTISNSSSYVKLHCVSPSLIHTLYAVCSHGDRLLICKDRYTLDSVD